LHTVDGRLVLTGGEIRFDPATGVASGEVVFDARATETGNADRDQKMHRKVLESELFPEIVFTAESLNGAIPASGEGEVVLAGTVAVHGISRPISMTARITRNGDRIRATAAVPIPYVAWGMKDPSVLVLRVAKEVNVSIDVEGDMVE
jgi:polyisoprenoid-binding protein YceI